MAPLTDPTRLAAYLDALGNWRFAGYIETDLTRQSTDWMLLELGNVESQIGQLMFEFVAAGGEIDEVLETRPEWSDKYQYHYDLRLPIHGKAVYIETRLHFEQPFVPDEPFIRVVNIHAV